MVFQIHKFPYQGPLKVTQCIAKSLGGNTLNPGIYTTESTLLGSGGRPENTSQPTSGTLQDVVLTLGSCSFQSHCCHEGHKIETFSVSARNTSAELRWVFLLSKPAQLYLFFLNTHCIQSLHMVLCSTYRQCHTRTCRNQVYSPTFPSLSPFSLLGSFNSLLMTCHIYICDFIDQHKI